MNKKKIRELIKEKTEFLNSPVYKGQWKIAHAHGFRQALCQVLGEKEPSAIKFDMDGIIKRALKRLKMNVNLK